MDSCFNILPGLFKVIQIIPECFFRLVPGNSSNNQSIVFRKYTSCYASQSFPFPKIVYFFRNTDFTIKRKKDTESSGKGYCRTYPNSFIVYRFFSNLNKNILPLSQFRNNRLTILFSVWSWIRRGCVLIVIHIHIRIIAKHILELLSVFPDIGKVKESIMLHSDIYKSSFNTRQYTCYFTKVNIPDHSSIFGVVNKKVS